jgi:hypothetical protein
MGEREGRRREARIAALSVRPRTYYRAVQCILAAGASFFSSLLAPAALGDLAGHPASSGWPNGVIDRAARGVTLPSNM